MEIGNMCFGHSRGNYPIPRGKGYEEILEDLCKALEDDSGYGTHFENDTFYTHPYCWCDKEDCPQCGTGKQFNFYHKESDTGISWYKYPLRDAYSNKELTKENLTSLILSCIDSLAK